MKNLYLYLVGIENECSWDEYDQIVVAAYSEADALEISRKWDDSYYYSGLSNNGPAICIGVAGVNVKRGKILASFHAG